MQKQALSSRRLGPILAVSLAGVCLMIQPILGQAGLPPARPAGLDLVRGWLDMARQHAPGEIDEPVKALRRLSFAELFEVQSGLEALAQLLREPGLSKLRSPRRDYTAVELKELAQMAVAESAGGTANVLMRQIALLHSDAMALRGAVTFVVDASAPSQSSDVTMVNDGVGLGRARMPPLWPIARAAIDAIQPSPSVDAWARQWYQATTAYFFYSFQLGALPAHLEARRHLFPDDVGAIVDTGCLYEAFAGPRVQATVRSERARGISLAVPERDAALARAQREYDAAIARDPAHYEARLRRARVTAQMGDTARAVDELAAIARGTEGDRDQRYIALLFLGEARLALGDADASADAYDAAMRLYPKAQSPAVGLLLARPHPAATDLARIEAVLKAGPVDRFDPWLDYHLGPGRKANAQLDILWHAFIAR